MKYAAFYTIEEARKHRAKHGGWIFSTEDGTEHIWFNLGMTQLDIMTHRVTRGLNGKIS